MTEILAIQAGISFVYVFLKGWQHQNVIGRKYAAAFSVSWAMAVFEVAVVTLVIETGWISAIPVGFGASCGIVASMWLYAKTEELGIAGTIRSMLR